MAKKKVVKPRTRSRGVEVDGTLFKAARLENGLGQEDVAGLDLSVTTIREMERGGRFDEASVFTATKAIGVPIASVLVGFKPAEVQPRKARLEVRYRGSIAEADPEKVGIFFGKIKEAAAVLGVEVLMEIAMGSIRLSCYMSEADVCRILFAFCFGELPEQVEEVTITISESRFRDIALRLYRAVGEKWVKLRTSYRGRRITGRTVNVLRFDGRLTCRTGMTLAATLIKDETPKKKARRRHS